MYNESYGYYRDLQPNTTSSTPDALRYLAKHLYGVTVAIRTSLHVIRNVVTDLLKARTVTCFALFMKIAIAFTRSLC